MYLSLLFWLALALPGYAVVRRFYPDHLKSGLLGILALSYLASFTLLSPVSILCYVLRAPLAIFSVAIILLLVIAVVDITRQKAWRTLGTLFAAAAGVELLIVVLDMAMGARIGTFIGGDARVHLGRIRFLVDHGFSNFDPSVGAPYFFPIYHTNLLHALCAACCQITRTDHMSVWFVSLPWAKLVVTSGVFYLAWTVFDRQWPAWIAAMFAVGHRGPVTFLLYPNQLSPYWLAPMALAFALRTCRPSVGWRDAVGLGAVSLILGQFHGLYVVHTALVTAPILAGGAVVALFKKSGRSTALWRAVCLVALATGVPFVIISHLGNVAGIHRQGLIDPDKDYRAKFVSIEGGKSMLAPSSALEQFGLGQWGTLIMASCVIAGLAHHRRKDVLLLLIAPAAAAGLLYTPVLCTFLLHYAKEAWVVLRLNFIFQITLMVLGAAAIAAWIETAVRLRPVRSLLSLAAFAAAIPFSGYEKPWTWRDVLTNAQAPSEKRLEFLNTIHGVMGFLHEHLPSESVVLTSVVAGAELVMLTDCHVIAPGSAANGVRDWPQRLEDLILLHKQDLSWDARRALLRKYHAKFFFPIDPHVEWGRGHFRRYWEHKPYVLVELDTD